MNNLDTLWEYIRKHAPSDGIEGFDGGAGKFRNLKDYHDKKILRWEHAGRAFQKKAQDLIDDPLDVCGLKRDGNELYTQKSASKTPVVLNVPVVAMLLAMSIVLNIDMATLERAKAILIKRAVLDVRDIEMRLKHLLSKGDLVQSARYPRLERKNFGSVSLGFEKVHTQYLQAAENAYEGATDLLTLMHQHLLQASSGIPDQFKKTFTDYFGNPDDSQDVAMLGFQGGAELGLAGSRTRGTVVRAVLACVWKGIQTRTVRMYFGGSSIIPNVQAYVPDLKTVRRDGRINVHLAIDFFGNDQNVIHDGMSVSRGGVLIHELTHALAGTIDVDQAFQPGRCKALARESLRGKLALVNAQSYASFVEDAFG